MIKKNFIFIQICIMLLFPVLCFSEEEQLVNLSCKDADIRDVLRGLAIQYGINIIPDNNVNGNVTIHLQNVPFEIGLQTLLETNGFEYEKSNGVYLVHTKQLNNNNFEISITDGKLSIDAENIDVNQLLREISKRTGLNITTESGLTGNITAHLSSIPLSDALYVLLEPSGFIVNENNGIYTIKTSKILQRGQGSYTILYRKGKLSIFDVKGVPATDILSDIASQCKINLAIVGNISGNVTLRLDNITLEQALDAITDITGTTYAVIDDVYYIGDPSVKPGQINPLLERKVIWLKHIDAQELMNSLPSDIARTNITIAQDRNALIVLGHKKMIERLESYLAEIDVDNADIRSRQQTALSVEVDDLGLITIDAKDATMESILREISIKKGINITILSRTGFAYTTPRTTTRTRRPDTTRPETPPQVPSSSAPPAPRVSFQSTSSAYGELVNLRINKATLDEVFNALFKGTNYTYKKEIIDNKEFYIFGTSDLSATNPLIVSKKVPLKYINAGNIMNFMPVTVPETNIIIIEEQNAIVLIGTQSMIDEIEKYIAQVDSPAPQIMIEALLVELVRGNSQDLGVNWTWTDGSRKNKVEVAPGLSASFDTLAGVPERFFAALKAMISQNKARILATPRAATTNGMKANIKVGWTDYFETTTEIYSSAVGATTPDVYVPSGGYVRRGFNTLESGITLEITPWVGASGEITVTVHPEIRDAKLISKEHSTIAERSLDTTVRVRDGEDIVIGGLIQRNESDRESKVPLFGSIPILGNLFKESNKMNNETELIIIVRPKIISNNAAPTFNLDNSNQE